MAIRQSVVTIPLLVVALSGHTLQLNPYAVGVAALAAGGAGAVLTCHVARGLGRG